MIDADGAKTGIELVPFSDAEDAYEMIMNRMQDLDEIIEPIKFKIIIPANDIPHAIKIYSALNNKISANERFSIIIAYVDSYGKFQVYKTIS